MSGGGTLCAQVYANTVSPYVVSRFELQHLIEHNICMEQIWCKYGANMVQIWYNGRRGGRRCVTLGCVVVYHGGCCGVSRGCVDVLVSCIMRMCWYAVPIGGVDVEVYQLGVLRLLCCHASIDNQSIPPSPLPL